jgi:hypothetical protein
MSCENILLPLLRSSWKTPLKIRAIFMDVLNPKYTKKFLQVHWILAKTFFHRIKNVEG